MSFSAASATGSPQKRQRLDTQPSNNKQFQLSQHTLSGGRRVTIVRDDHLLGGTKSRFVPDYLRSVQKSEVVYASSQEGFAQIALAACAKECGKKITIVTSHRREEHPNVKLVKKLGANLILVEKNAFLSVLQSRARKYVDEDSQSRELAPFGLMTDQIIASISTIGKALLAECEIDEPKECWLPTSSGTLLRGLMAAWPHCHFHGIHRGGEPPRQMFAVDRILFDLCSCL